MATRPERLLHDALTDLGRGDFETEPKDVLGKPDVVYRSSRMSQPLAVFVDGCFWHGCPSHYKPPKRKTKWWAQKLRRNQVRDRGVGWPCVHCERPSGLLVEQGWIIVRFWECEIALDPSGCAKKVLARLEQVTRR